MNVRSRFLSVAVAAIAALSVGVGIADARVGGSKSSGSRGTQSTTPPPATNTAPKAAPMERSTAPTTGAATAGAAATQAAKPGLLGGMGKGLLMGGLMGLGLAGLFGGFGAMGAMFGMILQIALVAGLAFLAYNFFRNRNRTAMAAAPASANMTGAHSNNPLNSNTMSREMQPQQANVSGFGGGAAPMGAPAPAPQKLDITSDDFNAFEMMLTKAQLSYGRQDRAALPFLATPEMVSYFNDDLDADASQGVRNELSDVKLLQGDLSEAWVEKDGEFATVAMRYALRDAKIEIKSGRVVSGSQTDLQEVTEIWTFRRPGGAPTQAWRISAIQQTN